MPEKKNILLIDEEEYTHILCKKALGEYDFEICGCQTYELGGKEIEIHSFDYLLIDMYSSTEKAEKIIQIFKVKNPNAKVIGFSTYFNSENEFLFFENGVDEVLFKPLSLNALKYKLTGYCSDELEEKNEESSTQNRYKLIVEASKLLTCEYDAVRDINYYDEMFCNTLNGNFSKNRALIEILLKDNIIYPRDIGTFKNVCKNVFCQKKNSSGYIRLRVKNDMNYYWYMLRVVVILDENEDIKKIIFSLEDADEAIKAQKIIQYTAEFDELTQIYNKNSFFSYSHQMITTNTRIKYVIIRVDIKRFSLVNDLYGLKEGDRLLKFMAKAIQDATYLKGIYGRIENDIFGICIPNEKKSIEEITDKINFVLATYPIDLDLTAYFGIYEVEDINVPVEIMLDRATLAVVPIKKLYTQYIAYYNDQLREKVVEEQLIISEMEMALEENQFEVYFQPKVQINDGKVIGAEALVRWIHPEKGIIQPSVFIPLFESNGFIYQLDCYVWDKTCFYLSELIKKGINNIPVSINISRIDLLNPHLIETLKNLVKKYDISPKLIELEITESAYTTDDVGNTIKELHRLGFIVAMDDFGTGYSSLNALKELDVDILKIDLRFLKNSEHNSKGRNILSSIVRMARWLHLPLIVEGLETSEQAKFLQSIGVYYAQGFLFYKPMKFKEYKNILLTNGKVKVRLKENIEDIDIDEIWNPDSYVNTLFNEIVGAVGMYERYKNNIEIIRANQTYFDLIKLSSKDFNMSARNIIVNIVKEDWNIVKEGFEKARHSNGCVTIIIRRILPQKNDLLWIEAKIKFVGCAGNRELFFASMQDVTEIQSRKVELFNKINNSYNLLFNTKEKGIVSYEDAFNKFDEVFSIISGMSLQCSLFRYVNENTIIPIYINEIIQRITGYKVNEFKNMNMMNIIHEDSIELLKKNLSESYKNHRSFLQKLHLKKSGGKDAYALIKCVLIFPSITDCIISVSAIDISNFVAVEKELTDLKEKELNSYKKLGGMFWEYDIVNQLIKFDDVTSKFYHLPREISPNPDNLIKLFEVDETESIQLYRLYKELNNGKESVSFEIMNTINKKRITSHIFYQTYYDKNHKPIKAIGVSDFSTTDSEVEARFSFMKRNHDKLSSLLYVASYNFTKNKLEKIEKFDHGSWKKVFRLSVSNAVDSLCKQVPNKADQLLLKNFFSKKSLQDKVDSKQLSYEIVFQRKSNDSYRYNKMTVEIIKIGKDDVHIIGYLEDVDDVTRFRLETEEKLRRDYLTNLYTLDSLKNVTEIYFKQKLNNCGVLILVDIDNVRDIGHRFGAKAQNSAIIKVADTLIKKFNNEDVYIARFEGDKFAMFFSNLPYEPNMVFNLARKVCQTLRIKFSFENDEFTITSSVGATAISNDEDEFEDVYSCADRALYAAKRRGKNSYEVYTKELVR